MSDIEYAVVYAAYLQVPLMYPTKLLAIYNIRMSLLEHFPLNLKKYFSCLGSQITKKHFLPRICFLKTLFFQTQPVALQQPNVNLTFLEYNIILKIKKKYFFLVYTTNLPINTKYYYSSHS